MELVGISQKLLIASALLNTAVTTLAFFYLVINGGVGWPSTIWKKLSGTLLVRSFISSWAAGPSSTPF